MGVRPRAIKFTPRIYIFPTVWAFLGLIVGYLGLSVRLLKTHRRR